MVPRPTKALKFLGVFLLFGAAMALLAGISLIWRGTTLDKLWALNPKAYEQLAPLGKPVGIAFLLLSAVLAVAAMGWLHRRLWSWKLVLFLIGAQLSGSLINVFRGEMLKGAAGFFVAGALLLYVLRAATKAQFS